MSGSLVKFSARRAKETRLEKSIAQREGLAKVRDCDCDHSEEEGMKWSRRPPRVWLKIASF